MKNSKALFIAQAAMIAALYVVLTYLANALGLANNAVQVRFSEALTILPFFTPAAIPGLFVGCLLSNILTGCIAIDVICGSLTTLVAACMTYAIRKIATKKHSAKATDEAGSNVANNAATDSNPAANTDANSSNSGNKKKIYSYGKVAPWLAPIPPIVLNTIVVPFVLAYAYHIEGTVPMFMVTVGAGEIISCGVLGLLLFFALRKQAVKIFGEFR